MIYQQDSEVTRKAMLKMTSTDHKEYNLLMIYYFNLIADVDKWSTMDFTKDQEENQGWFQSEGIRKTPRNDNFVNNQWCSWNDDSFKNEIIKRIKGLTVSIPKSSMVPLKVWLENKIHATRNKKNKKQPAGWKGASNSKVRDKQQRAELKEKQKKKNKTSQSVKKHSRSKPLVVSKSRDTTPISSKRSKEENDDDDDDDVENENKDEMDPEGILDDLNRRFAFESIVESECNPKDNRYADYCRIEPLKGIIRFMWTYN